jgi:hypothetical protein
MPVFLILRIFLSLILFRGLEVFLIGGLAYLALRLLKKRLTPAVCFLMATVALTPALAFAFLTSLGGPFSPFSGLIYYAAYLIYFLGGLKSCLQKAEDRSQI